MKSKNLITNILYFLMVLVVCVMLIGVVFAQDDPIQIVSTDVSSPINVATMIGQVLLAAIVVPGTAPIITTLTALLKRFVPASVMRSHTIAAALSAIIYVGFWLAVQFGLEAQFELGLESVYQIGALILGLVSARLVSHKIYDWSAQTKLPLLGYKRTEQNTSQ